MYKIKKHRSHVNGKRNKRSLQLTQEKRDKDLKILLQRLRKTFGRLK